MRTPIETRCDQGRFSGELKPKQEWDKIDNERSEDNAQAHFIIFNGVSPNKFHRISACKCAKEAQDILQFTHEGTSTMKLFKVQMLNSRFESIRMQENRTFSTFYVELNNIVNSSFNLGEQIPN